MLRHKYRVVTDSYCGFEVQMKRWWFPVWVQVGHDGGIGANTHTSLERAKAHIERLKTGGVVYESS